MYITLNYNDARKACMITHYILLVASMNMQQNGKKYRQCF